MVNIDNSLQNNSQMTSTYFKFSTFKQNKYAHFLSKEYIETKDPFQKEEMLLLLAQTIQSKLQNLDEILQQQIQNEASSVKFLYLTAGDIHRKHNDRNNNKNIKIREGFQKS